MPPGIVKFVWKTALYGGIGALIVGGYAILNPEAFVRLPDGHNSQLVGDWYTGGRVFYRHYRFNADGTGQLWYGRREPRDFHWGTEGGRMRMKYRSFNGWSAPQFDFKVGGGELSLNGHGAADSADLRRDPPASSRLE